MAVIEPGPHWRKTSSLTAAPTLYTNVDFPGILRRGHRRSNSHSKQTLSQNEEEIATFLFIPA